MKNPNTTTIIRTLGDVIGAERKTALEQSIFREGERPRVGRTREVLREQSPIFEETLALHAAARAHLASARS